MTSLLCASCCGPLAQSLSRLGSVRCHDCRDERAPVRSECILSLRRPPVEMPDELDHRETDGLEVRLLWYRESGRVAVRVEDSRTGDRFELRVHSAHALDAFNHPFAYTSPRTGDDENLLLAEAA